MGAQASPECCRAKVHNMSSSPGIAVAQAGICKHDRCRSAAMLQAMLPRLSITLSQLELQT